MGGDVDRGRVERLAEIAERDLGQQLVGVVLVEGAPAAASALHADQPVDAALASPPRCRAPAISDRCGRAPARSARRRCRRRRDRNCWHIRRPSRPASHAGSFTDQSPGTQTCRLSTQSTAFSTASACTSSAPASSKASRVRIVSQTGLLVAWMKVASPTSTRQPGSSRQARPLGHHRMVERIALHMERHQAVDPRRLDAAPAAVGILMADRSIPAHGGRPRRATGVRPMPVAELLQGVQDLVGLAEEQVPAAGVLLGRQVVIECLAAARKQRVEAALRRQRPARPARGQHGDRHQRRPRPLREMIDVEGKPQRQPDHFRRQVGRLLPRPFADQGQPVAGEDADIAQPALGFDPVRAP